MFKKFPVGFYILGLNIPDGSAVARRWSEQCFCSFYPGECRTYTRFIVRPTKCYSAHAWGFCRLVSVQIATRLFEPVDGALFIDVDYLASEGMLLKVTIEAFTFENLAIEVDGQ